MKILVCLLVVCSFFQGSITLDMLSRWVASVRSFSTQYSTPGYGAVQIIGAPNCYPTYSSLSWCSAAATPASEFIEFEINETVCVSSIETYEVSSPGFVTQILAMMPNGTWDALYTGAATFTPPYRIFSPTLRKTNYVTKIFRLNMICSLAANWVGLDAVRVNGSKTCDAAADCVPALWTNSTLSPEHNLCSPNNQHKVVLNANGGILIDGQQWLSGDPSALSSTMNYTQNHQLIVIVNGNTIKWRLDLPNSPDNGLPGNVTVTDDGLLQIVNARGVPLWNHKQGYLLPRFVSAYGPNWRTAPLVDDRNNATCTPVIGLIVLRIAPTPRNTSRLAAVFGTNLTCTQQFSLIIPGGTDVALAARCALVGNSGSTVCTFSCMCPTELCETVAIVRSGCAGVAICEVTLQ